jgi:hypothetical protein
MEENCHEPWSERKMIFGERTYWLELVECGLSIFCSGKKKTTKKDFIKFIAVQIIMLVLWLVTPCAHSLAPSRPEDGDRILLRKCFYTDQPNVIN